MSAPPTFPTTQSQFSRNRLSSKAGPKAPPISEGDTA